MTAPLTASQITSGLMDDGEMPFVSGINCFECGRFVGRDGYIGIECYEMSAVVAGVEGQCRGCLDRERAASLSFRRGEEEVS